MKSFFVKRRISTVIRFTASFARIRVATSSPYVTMVPRHEKLCHLYPSCIHGELLLIFINRDGVMREKF